MPHSKGWHHTEEAKEKISEASKRCWADPNYQAKVLPALERGRYKGHHAWNKGKTWSNEVKQKFSIAKKGRSQPQLHTLQAREKAIRKIKERGVFRKIWADPVLRDALILNRMKVTGKHPNKLERHIISILQCYFPGEWKYNGNGVVILGGLAPDFININGKKALIEVFGDYWHGRTDRRQAKGMELESVRRRVFSELGYKTLVLWEGDIKKMDNLEVATQIKNFIEVKNETVA